MQGNLFNTISEEEAKRREEIVWKKAPQENKEPKPLPKIELNKKQLQSLEASKLAHRWLHEGFGDYISSLKKPVKWED